MRLAILTLALIASSAAAADNELTTQEKADGWLLLFDGKSLDGWKADGMAESKRPVEDGCINPYKCGGSGMYQEKLWGDYVLSLDFKLSKGCNSGVFVRTSSLEYKKGKDLGYNGIEVQLLDSTDAGYHDTGAFYDLVKPTKNAMKPIGEWNHLVIESDKNILSVELNGEKVNRIDLDEWTEKNKRPDGTPHKFDEAYKDHPRKGYIGLQDHGADCWFKNIKLKPAK